ncbi:MAG: hypothetical protein IPJ89_01050 [Candidatus Iainarchaeum archaeon]|uniref:Uncharacterized protein n=1 Tax=Candidatus Iainarchaeum sp. TaxID=3101447 RepID=A0A7T9DK57_9ARCH|nr:MAG: hypothetical protein IPJ89_01050 [Candidatus Diapherotrites archaeon]
MNSTRAQVATEILLSILILLLVFVVVLLLIHTRSVSNLALQQNLQEEGICTKLASIITYMSSNPPYTETRLELEFDTNIVAGTIFVGDRICPFLGNVSNVILYRGIVKAFDVNGLIIFTNDLNYSPFNPPVQVPNSNANVTAGIVLLTDDQNQVWSTEVQADDVAYAVSLDDQLVDPDWVEFRFSNLGLTPADTITNVSIYIKHLQGNLIGLTEDLRRIQCWNGTTWLDIEAYTPSYSETLYQSPNLSSCISDYNLANNARLRMTYEPSGSGSGISIDYGRLDVNFLEIGQTLDLWELAVDLPQPVDFRTDVNSTANTFGPGAGNDGWDWNINQFGGIAPQGIQFNVDPNGDGSIVDSNVPVNQQLQIRMGGGAPNAGAFPDDNAFTGPAVSGAYGIQVDVNSSMWSRIQGGGQLLLSFAYLVDADAGWGNAADAGEEAWVKARFGSSGNMNYLGSDLDTSDDDGDASPEIWFADTPRDTTAFFTQDISSFVTGTGTYYLELGGALSDWDLGNEGVGIYIDNINLVVT